MLFFNLLKVSFLKLAQICELAVTFSTSVSKMKTSVAIFFFLLAFIKSETKATIVNQSIQIANAELKEKFVDSSNIGWKNFNKIELSLYNIADSNYVIIKFYIKTRDKSWKLKQTFSYEKDGIKSLDTKLSDFNNDGLKDMTYISAVAARGANEVRRLFIYDKAKDEIILMKNSEDYPNMLYNKQLKCIDAFLVYGGCSTIFLKIKGDSLREFAGVALDNSLTVYTVDQNGKEKLIRKDKTTKWTYVRFKNYNPLIPYD